jgi:uncharacterized protein YdeI (YjbR/CyaY-like superfamily)
MKLGRMLDVTSAAAWRRWLEKHHARAAEIWLVYHRKASGRGRISYNDAVDEALCFGWIDSTGKPIDEGRWAQRFTPRRKGSPISELNKTRVRRLAREGRMTPAGLAALAHEPDLHRPRRLTLAPDVAAALRADPAVWRNYRAFPEVYRRIRIAWIEGARKRPDVFRVRLAYFVRMTAKNKRYGMVQG